MPNLGATDEERQRNLKLFREWAGSRVPKRWPEVATEGLRGLKVNC